MKFSSLLAAAWAMVVSCLICGCGDTFRPVATPLPQPSPDPQAFRLAVFTSCQLDPNPPDPNNPLCLATGATSQASDVNVSGDTIEGVVPVGHSPIFALVQNNSGLAAVQVTTADFDNDTVTQHGDSHLSNPAIVSAPVTIGLTPGAKPTFIASAGSALYVAESGLNVVGVLGGFPLALTAEIPVGATPMNLTVLPNSTKIYVVNQASGNVTVISTADNSVLTTVPVGTAPVWAVASADSSHVYVVNQGSGTVSVIDATSDTVVANLQVGTAPNYAAFDAKNQRVLVTNPKSSSLSVISADPTSPLFLKSVTNVTVGANPRSVTPLADGTRVYVANTGSNSVSVINSLNLAVSKTIPVGKSPVWISSDADSTKVMTANRDSFDASVILTSTDSELTDTAGNPQRILAPPVNPNDPNCAPTTTMGCARLSPIFISIAG
jgi:YVTN family beta-propeller protein